jgi:AcrR family transcriptional regulator
MPPRNRSDKTRTSKQGKHEVHPHKVAHEPQQDRSRRTQEKLFEAAVELLCEGGKSELAVTELTRRSGVSVGAFYNLFSDRRELLLAVFEKLRADALAEIDKVVALLRESPANAIEEVLVTSASGFREKRGALFRLMQANAIEIPELVERGNALIEEMALRLAPVIAGATRVKPREAALMSIQLVRALVATLDHIELFGVDLRGVADIGKPLTETLIRNAIRGVFVR